MFFSQKDGELVENEIVDALEDQRMNDLDNRFKKVEDWEKKFSIWYRTDFEADLKTESTDIVVRSRRIFCVLSRYACSALESNLDIKDY